MSSCACDSVLQKFPEVAGIVKVTQVQFIDEIVKVQNMMEPQASDALEMREREGTDVLPAAAAASA